MQMIQQRSDSVDSLSVIVSQKEWVYQNSVDEMDGTTIEYLKMINF